MDISWYNLCATADYGCTFSMTEHPPHFCTHVMRCLNEQMWLVYGREDTPEAASTLKWPDRARLPDVGAH